MTLISPNKRQKQKKQQRWPPHPPPPRSSLPTLSRLSVTCHPHPPTPPPTAITSRRKGRRASCRGWVGLVVPTGSAEAGRTGCRSEHPGSKQQVDGRHAIFVCTFRNNGSGKGRRVEGAGGGGVKGGLRIRHTGTNTRADLTFVAKSAAMLTLSCAVLLYTTWVYSPASKNKYRYKFHTTPVTVRSPTRAGK